MTSPTVLIIGGSGAQGKPIVKELAQRGFKVRVLTRDANTENCKNLASLNNVTLSIGATDDEEALRATFTGVDLAFVNLNSWALGIKNEIYWGIRIFEIAVQSGVKHYIWSSLDNYFHGTKYDDSLRTGHYYGKGHVEQWISALPQTPMRWSIITTSPYIEQLWSLQFPKVSDDGEYEFRLPLDDGAIPYTYLEDMGYYVHWIFSHPEDSAGLNLKVAVEHVSLGHLAATFTEVTGKPAKAVNLTIDEWFDQGPISSNREYKLGSSGKPTDDQSLLTIYQNFSAWWRLYQRSGGNKGILRRDYDFLDKIHPQRVKTLKQWMERVNYTADKPRQTTVRNLLDY